MVIPVETASDTAADSAWEADSTRLLSAVVSGMSFEAGAVVESVVAVEGVSTEGETFVGDDACASG